MRYLLNSLSLFFFFFFFCMFSLKDKLSQQAKVAYDLIIFLFFFQSFQETRVNEHGWHPKKLNLQWIKIKIKINIKFTYISGIIGEGREIYTKILHRSSFSFFTFFIFFIYHFKGRQVVTGLWLTKLPFHETKLYCMQASIFTKYDIRFHCSFYKFKQKKKKKLNCKFDVKEDAYGIL